VSPTGQTKWGKRSAITMGGLDGDIREEASFGSTA
jgi:hypothetical protein